MNEENIQYLKRIVTQHTQLCHAQNILGKIKDRKTSARKIAALNVIMPEYSLYLKEQLSITGWGEEEIKKRVELLNAYYNFLHENDYENLFSPQSKFRPTILEEFLFILFKDFVFWLKTKDSDNLISSGSVKAYSNIYFKAKNFDDFVKSPKIGVNEKNQDYAIYRKFMLILDGKQHVTVNVPAIAVEVKTYIDKTMLDSIIATAEKVKSGNPHALFVAVAECYDVSLDVDPAYSRIDQIYILRKSSRKAAWKNVQEDVVIKLFDNIRSHFERPWADIEKRMKNDGTVI